MTGPFDPRLVILSWGVAALASLFFVRIVHALPDLDAHRARRWTRVGTSLSALGLWAAHLVALLAFHRSFDAGLGLPVVAASAVPVLVGIGASLAMAVRGALAGRRLWVVAGILVCGLGAMHHAGTAGMQWVPPARHDLRLLLPAFAVATLLVAAVLAFTRTRTAAVPRALVGGAVLGAVAVALQVVAMAAMGVDPDAVSTAGRPGETVAWLALLLAALGSAGVVIALRALAADQRVVRVDVVAEAGADRTARATGDPGDLREQSSATDPDPVDPVVGGEPIVASATGVGPWTWDAATDPVVRFRAGAPRFDVLTALSHNAAGLWGYPPGAPGAPTRLIDLFHADDWNADRIEHWRMRFAAGASRITEDVRVRRADGVLRWHQLSLAPDGGAGGWVGHLVDVDERKHGELHAHAQIRRLSELADGQRDASRDAAVLEDTREMLHLAETLPEAREIIRRACGRLLPGWSGTLTQIDPDARATVAACWGESAPMVERFGTRDCWALRSHRVHRYINAREDALCAHLVPDASGVLGPHFCLPLVDHREAIGSLHLFAPHAALPGDAEVLRTRAEGLAKVLGQALANLRLRLTLREQAMRDGLTGLYQRRFLEEGLPAELQRAHRDRRAVSVAVIDVDHLRTFNERHGRDAGDVVLTAIGRVLAASLRGYDMACRVGGEEVALVLPGCELEDALIRLEEIRCAVEALQLEHGGAQLPVVTVSVGIAEARGGTADALMLRADQALQRAKHNGRNRIELADREGPVLA